MNNLLTYGIGIRNYQKESTQKRNSYLDVFELEKFEAEKEVLDNLNKIELMQCLGLKDKRGKLIYFGDVLLDETNNTLLTPVIEVTNNEHTLFFKPIRLLSTEINMGCKSTYSQTLTVLGNIYQNSELFVGLKEKNKFISLVISTNQTEHNNTTILIKLKKPLLN